MQSHFEKSYGIPLILNKYIKVKNGKYLVFCRDKEHLNAMRDVVIGWFKTAGIKDVHSYAVYSDYPDKEKDYKDFQDDKSDSAKILFSINMLNEGLHIEDISGVLMLRTTQSNLIYLQQLGRLLEADNMDKYLLVFDFVNNFSSVNDGIGLLKEIREAIAREKENNPDFDDSWAVDIDTFFVLEQVKEIQELFQEIEGRLQSEWDVMFQEYCKFYEVNGHGDVPETEEYKRLNIWCLHQRQNLKNAVLKEKHKQLLDENGFIWDVLKYRFEKNVFDCITFYEKNGRLPSTSSQDESERKLRVKIQNYKKYISGYPQWKQDLLKKIPTLFNEKSSMFNRFYGMALIYKHRYGHVDIKAKDIIDGYNIGTIYSCLLQAFQNEELTENQIEKLRAIGIDITMGMNRKKFNEKMKLAMDALKEGMVITSKNRIYNGVNLYAWGYIHRNDFSEEEQQIMQKLIPNQENKRAVNIIDLDNKQTYTYSSMADAGQALYSEFHVVDNKKKGISIISCRLTGATKNPIYKGRFRFEYADDQNGDDKAN